jgi:EmrB/QacA subfamily drug resistance transporter
VQRKWWTLIAVCAGIFMLLLDVTVVFVALPQIQRGLHASFGDLQWVADAYALSLASLLLTTGVLADMYGRRLIFGLGLGVFTIGSLTCGIAQSPLMLVASRGFQGIGGAMMFATSLALLAQDFRGKERGIAFAAWGAVTGVATATGPVLGGLLTTGISWRAIFLVNLPVGVFALAVTILRVGESRSPETPKPDWPGFVTLTVGLVGVVYGLIKASEHGWGDTEVAVLLAVGGAFLVAFLVIEALVPHPLFDLSLFRIPTFLGGSVAAFGMNGSVYAVMLYLVLYLQDILGYSALQTGLRFLVMSGVTFVAATASGRLSSQLPVRWMIGVGLLMVAGSLVWMSGLSASSNWTHLLGGFALGGLGSGLVNPPLASTAVGVVGPRRSGMASGVNSTFRQVGIAAGVAAYGTIFATRLATRLRANLAVVPGLSRHVASVTSAVTSGNVSHLFASTPPRLRPPLAHAVRASFTGGLNDILIVSAVLAAAAGVVSLALIRRRDFVASAPATGGEPTESGELLGTTEAAPLPHLA